MASPQENIARFQEIANRGLQDRLPVDKRAIFDEAMSRGIIKGVQPNVDNISGNINNISDDSIRSPISGGLIDSVASVAEPLATLVTGAIAEPVSGIVGIAQALNPLAEEGAGARAVEATREALTFQPRTQAGQVGLQAVGEAVAPVAEVLQGAETFLGDTVFEATGSPALAAAAKTIPTALLEVLGVAAGKGVLKSSAKVKAAAKQKEVTRAIVEAAPEIEQLKDVARSIFKEIDDSGVTLQPKAFKGLVNRLNNAVKKQGFDPDLTPKTAAVLRRFQSEVGKPKTLTEIDTLRKVAQKAAQSLEPADASLGVVMIDNIDQFLDVVSPTAFKKGAVGAGDITPKFKVARELWGRARRSELINESFEKAGRQASGFENGIRTQFRSILNNKKKSRFFKPDELKAMDQVVKGTGAENLAKLVGRFGFSEGQASSFLGGSIGVAGGAAVGGPIGAVAVPIIGQVSKKLAQRLTRKNAEFANTVVRAGTNAQDIAEAYIKNTPKKLRSSSELSELLSRPDIALDKLLINKSKILKEAAEIARGNKILTAVTGAPGAIQASQTKEEQ